MSDFANSADLDEELESLEVVDDGPEASDHRPDTADAYGEDPPEPVEDTRIDRVALRRQIEDYYLPTQLVDAILEMGGIPESSEVTLVGIGFIDIADYTYLSQFLSPQENQDVLNGLYTAFTGVLKRHGGYLNKLEGDSLMFHYGGNIDPRVRNMDDAEAKRYIAKELFYTCVEMQRVCALFNQANERFLVEGVSEEARDSLRRAFNIISTLRNTFELARNINALFQIRIRIGANIGKVTIGNFGPDGAKQWDVIGTAVIDAKRMESTAPVGGLRISGELYQALVETRVAEEYYTRFLREARLLRSYYRDITMEELFRFSEVEIKEKRGALFQTYSVQVTPNLPESIAKQVVDLINIGPAGADRVIDLLKYYRGNPYVINAIEDAFTQIGVVLRKRYILSTMYPLQFEAIERQFDGNVDAITEHVEAHFTLFALLEKLGRFQDIVKQPDSRGGADTEFVDYDRYMSAAETRIRAAYAESRKTMVQRAYFFNVVFPLVFASIRSSIIEYQIGAEELETLAGA
ncbi:MAG: adenylate/guanylate cyclase domain-containing protein [Spirochaetaceae bacterium]|nr:MAG: adenylate/guanylate cyclase domain-containing protein [Spirochaetaceae bacterium]